MPSIAVVIPNLNHGAFLPEVVASCTSGPDAADEVVVVDDGSTDDSPAVLRRLSDRVGNLRVVVHPENRGAAAALNTGLAHTRADWVLMRAADDLCPPGSLRVVRDVAERFPSAGVITGDVAYFSHVPQRGVRETLGRSPDTVAIDSASFVERFGGNIIHGASTFVRTEWARAAGGLDVSLRWHCDWYFLLSLGLARGFVYVPEVLGWMRLNARSYNNAGTADPDQRAEVLERLIQRLETDDEDLGRFLAVGCLDFFGEPLLRQIQAGGPRRLERFAALFGPPSPAITAARDETGLAMVFRAFLRRHRAALVAHAGHVAILGAGGHTRQLLRAWAAAGLALPAVVLDGTPRHTALSIDGVPVRPLLAPLDAPSGLIVLSSKSYEPELGSLAAQRFPGVPILRIWGADESGPA